MGSLAFGSGKEDAVPMEFDDEALASFHLMAEPNQT